MCSFNFFFLLSKIYMATHKKKTWKKQVEEETEKVGLKKEDALRRDKWRDRVREIAEGMG